MYGVYPHMERLGEETKWEAAGVLSNNKAIDGGALLQIQSKAHKLGLLYLP